MSEKVRVHRDEKEVSRELKSTYGSAVVLLTSNPEELDKICNKLKDEYDIVMDTEVLENRDYAKVIVRKELNKNASDNIH